MLGVVIVTETHVPWLLCRPRCHERRTKKQRRGKADFVLVVVNCLRAPILHTVSVSIVMIGISGIICDP